MNLGTKNALIVTFTSLENISPLCIFEHILGYYLNIVCTLSTFLPLLVGGVVDQMIVLLKKTYSDLIFMRNLEYFYADTSAASAYFSKVVLVADMTMSRIDITGYKSWKTASCEVFF